MAGIRKVSSPHKRKNHVGWWVRWRDPATRKNKFRAFQTKSMADQFRTMQFYRLNSGDFVAPVDLNIDTVITEFMQRYDVNGLSEASKDIMERTLDRFKESTYLIGTKGITQAAVNKYLLDRRKDTENPYTINKDIGRLRTFFRWLKDRKYLHHDITLNALRCPRINVSSLPTESIKELFKASPCPTWRVRLLISLCTGLRSGDVDQIRLKDIDLDRKTINTYSKKTGKVFIGRPIPDDAIPELKQYIDGLPKEQEELFADRNVRKTWEALRESAGLTCTRQDLRKTFATLIQKTGSLQSAQDLLEHSDKRVTEFYTDQEVVLRWKINQLPVKEWLSGV